MLLLFNSCTKKHIEYPELETENISFSANIQPIFDNNCITCHNKNSDVLDLKEGFSYLELLNKNFLNVVQPKESKLIIKINEQHPQLGIPNSYEKEIIEKWMEKGAVNN